MNAITTRGSIRSFTLMAGVAFCAACAKPGPRPGNPFDAHNGDWVRIVVENHGFYDVTVHVLREGVPFRLGTVQGMTTATFRADRGLLGATGSYQLTADRIGVKGTFTTDPIPQLFGSTTLWRLEQSEWQSTLVIR